MISGWPTTLSHILGLEDAALIHELRRHAGDPSNEAFSTRFAHVKVGLTFHNQAEL